MQHAISYIFSTPGGPAAQGAITCAARPRGAQLASGTGTPLKRVAIVRMRIAAATGGHYPQSQSSTF